MQYLKGAPKRERDTRFRELLPCQKLVARPIRYGRWKIPPEFSITKFDKELGKDEAEELRPE